MNVRLVFTNKYVNLNTLDYLCTHFKIPHGTHHRAEDDAGMCTRLFLKKYTIVCIITHLVRFTKLSAHYDMHNSTFQLEYVIKECPTYFYVFVLDLFFKLVLAYATKRAHPIFWNIGKRCTCYHAVIRVTNFRIINIATHYTYVFLHKLSKFFSWVNNKFTIAQIYT